MSIRSGQTMNMNKNEQNHLLTLVLTSPDAMATHTLAKMRE